MSEADVQDLRDDIKALHEKVNALGISVAKLETNFRWLVRIVSAGSGMGGVGAILYKVLT